MAQICFCLPVDSKTMHQTCVREMRQLVGWINEAPREAGREVKHFSAFVSTLTRHVLHGKHEDNAHLSLRATFRALFAPLLTLAPMALRAALFTSMLHTLAHQLARPPSDIADHAVRAPCHPLPNTHTHTQTLACESPC